MRTAKNKKKTTRRNPTSPRVPKLSSNAKKVLALLVKTAGELRIVEASKYFIMDNIAMACPKHPLDSLVNQGYISKIGEGKTGACIYKILKTEVDL